jgi:hypothetical protein
MKHHQTKSKDIFDFSFLPKRHKPIRKDVKKHLANYIDKILQCNCSKSNESLNETNQVYEIFNKIKTQVPTLAQHIEHPKYKTEINWIIKLFATIEKKGTFESVE